MKESKHEKIIIKLSGIPGGGKTTLANFLVKEHDFEFIEVDKFYEETKRADSSVEWYQDKEYIKNVYAQYEKELQNSILKNQKVVFESSGAKANEFTKKYREFSIKNKARFYEIVVDVDPQIAKDRIFKRNKTNYKIKVDPNSVDFFQTETESIIERSDFIINGNRSKGKLIKEIDSIYNLLNDSYVKDSNILSEFAETEVYTFLKKNLIHLRLQRDIPTHNGKNVDIHFEIEQMKAYIEVRLLQILEKNKKEIADNLISQINFPERIVSITTQKIHKNSTQFIQASNKINILFLYDPMSIFRIIHLKESLNGKIKYKLSRNNLEPFLSNTLSEGINILPDIEDIIDIDGIIILNSMNECFGIKSNSESKIEELMPFVTWV